MWNAVGWGGGGVNLTKGITFKAFCYRIDNCMLHALFSVFEIPIEIVIFLFYFFKNASFSCQIYY